MQGYLKFNDKCAANNCFKQIHNAGKIMVFQKSTIFPRSQRFSELEQKCWIIFKRTMVV